jgi:hypothetical protein
LKFAKFTKFSDFKIKHLYNGRRFSNINERKPFLQIHTIDRSIAVTNEREFFLGFSFMVIGLLSRKWENQMQLYSRPKILESISAD